MQKILLFLCLVAFSHAVQSTKVSAREPEAKHPPLPHTVSAWLEKHAATLGPTTSPPKGWRILESQSGDLNGDGRNDFAVVLENGVVKKTGTGQALLNDPAIKEAYLGTGH